MRSRSTRVPPSWSARPVATAAVVAGSGPAQDGARSRGRSADNAGREPPAADPSEAAAAAGSRTWSPGSRPLPSIDGEPQRRGLATARPQRGPGSLPRQPRAPSPADRSSFPTRQWPAAAEIQRSSVALFKGAPCPREARKNQAVTPVYRTVVMQDETTVLYCTSPDCGLAPQEASNEASDPMLSSRNPGLTQVCAFPARYRYRRRPRGLLRLILVADRAGIGRPGPWSEASFFGSGDRDSIFRTSRPAAHYRERAKNESAVLISSGRAILA